MKKTIFFALLFVSFMNTSFAQDKKVSEFIENTTPSINAFVMVIQDGTNQRVSIDNLLKADDPINITSFINNRNDLENGTTVTSTQLDWVINDTVTSQSLNNSIGSISAALRTYTHTSTYSTNRTYTLSVDDGSGHTDTASTQIRFLNSNYYGVSSNTTLNDGQINALGHSLSSSKAQTRSLSPSAQYIYIAYPSAYGSATFTVNGLSNNDWTLSTQSHTNASGATVSYNVYRTNNLLTGTYTIGVN